MESVKPICLKFSAVLTVSDELVQIGDRYYVKATAKLFDDKESLEVTAYAREEESKKGMDGSQVTGASSSYARKYALNGLFNIDDTKDSDATNTHDKDDAKTSKPQPKQSDQPSQEELAKVEELKHKKIDKLKIESLEKEIERTGSNKANMLKKCKVSAIEDLTLEQYNGLMKIFENIKDKPKTDLGL